MEEEIIKWRKSHMSFLTCIKCDKKCGVAPKHSSADDDICKCVSPIKVDMNAMDHHLFTEMTYLIQSNKTSEKYDVKLHELNALKGYNLSINPMDSSKITVPDYVMQKRKEIEGSLVQCYYSTAAAPCNITDEPSIGDVPPIFNKHQGTTIYWGHPLADLPSTEEEIKEFNINTGKPINEG